MDAQALLAKLIEYHTHSTKAKLKGSDMMEYLTSTKYNSAWTQGAHKFILHWLNTAKVYNEMQKTDADRLSDGVKLSLLQTAVSDVRYTPAG